MRLISPLARAAFDPSQDPVEQLLLGATLRETILAHLHAALPNEGCGLLAVDRDQPERAVRFYPGDNVDQSPSRYTMNPKTVIAAFSDMEANNLRLGAIVHSHPTTPATPSATDLREAHYLSALMLICSFAGGQTDLRAWAIAAAQFGGATVLGERPIITE